MIDQLLESLYIFSFANPVSSTVVFIYGALFGSFLNVVIYRLPLERSIVYPGSACGTCGTPLSWWENLPIISYLLLRGRCHTCGSPYSCRYAVVEAVTGSVAVWLLHHYGGVGIPFLYGFAFFCLLLVVFFMDLDHWIILDSVSLSGVVVGLACAYWLPARGDNLALWAGLEPGLQNICSSLAGALLGAGFFWAIQVIGSALARQEAMGSGDIKLAAMIGAFLGWQFGVVAFFLSFVLGAVTATALIAFRARKGRDPVPLGTFMAVAAFVVLLYGPQILGGVLDWPSLLAMW